MWCLGILLYELFHKKTPFDGQVFDENKDGNRRIEFRKDLDPSIVRLIKDCIQIDPRARWSTDQILNSPLFKENALSSKPIAKKQVKTPHNLYNKQISFKKKPNVAVSKVYQKANKKLNNIQRTINNVNKTFKTTKLNGFVKKNNGYHYKLDNKFKKIETKPNNRETYQKHRKFSNPNEYSSFKVTPVKSKKYINDFSVYAQLPRKQVNVNNSIVYMSNINPADKVMHRKFTLDQAPTPNLLELNNNRRTGSLRRITINSGELNTKESKKTSVTRDSTYQPKQQLMSSSMVSLSKPAKKKFSLSFINNRDFRNSGIHTTPLTDRTYTKTQASPRQIYNGRTFMTGSFNEKLIRHHNNH